MTGVRLPADLEAAVLKWARLQRDKPSKAEAIRRLVERALVAEPPAPSARSKGAPKAAEMAVVKSTSSVTRRPPTRNAPPGNED
jgi:hypothetical protein